MDIAVSLALVTLVDSHLLEERASVVVLAVRLVEVVVEVQEQVEVRAVQLEAEVDL